MNPELRRYSWLELTVSRLITVPLITFGVAYLVYLSTHSGSALIATALFLAFIQLQILGTSGAYTAVTEEVARKTWDTQKLTSLNAWSMTWGKLLGSTIDNWYGALCAILVYFVGAAMLDFSAPVLSDLALCFGAGLFAQAVAFMAGLEAAGKRNATSRTQSLLVKILCLVVALPFSVVSFLPPAMSIAINWHGIGFEPRQFMLASLGAFLGWALLGAYRMMRSELAFRAYPWAWPLFVIFLMGYAAGFFSFAGPPIDRWVNVDGVRWFIGFGVALSATFLMALRESKSPVDYRKLISAAREGDFSRAATLLPRWSLSLTIVVATAIYLSALGVVVSFPGRAISLGTFPAACVAFLMRDIILFHLVHFGDRSAERAETLTVIYLFLLYFLIPSIVQFFGGFALLAWFYPLGVTPSGIAPGLLSSVLPPLLQALLLAVLVVLRWRMLIPAQEAGRNEYSSKTRSSGEQLS